MVDALRQSLHEVEPAALLVEPRILRRIIRLDRRLAGLGLSVPHHSCYTIQRERLLAFADRSELELSATAELPKTVILLAKPTSDEMIELESADSILQLYWRLLFHCRVHVELERRLAEHGSGARLSAERMAQIGRLECSEIRAVLVKDELLFPDPTDLETYLEFAAVYLELRYFAEQDLPVYFPSVRDWDELDRIVSQDIYHSQILEATRLTPHFDGLGPAPHFFSMGKRGDAHPVRVKTRRLSPAKRRKLQAAAERACQLGNSVKSAILWTRAAGTPAAADLPVEAMGELKRLVERLRKVLSLTEADGQAWTDALSSLLCPAAHGFWSAEARLLYDLQKVCVESERGVFQLSWVEWIRSGGHHAARRPLPLLRDVLVTKHLRSAHRRLPTARIATADRERLAELLDASVHRVEQKSRDHIRPLIVQTLDQVGLVPQNLPEQVARGKLVEELLDSVVEHGFLNMGGLRDALSKNDLKLPDLSGPLELLRGDRLLRADRRLAKALDGVYRPGAIYLRWPQRMSSVAFGTELGRFATKFVILPYGAAYLALEGLWHLAMMATGHHTHDDHVAEGTAMGEEPGFPWISMSLVALFGTLLLLLIHRPEFRTWCRQSLGSLWKIVRRAVVELPARLVRSPLVQQILASQTYAAIRCYALRPGMLAAVILLPALLYGHPWSARTGLEVFLLAALFLNSPVGRYADEWISDLLVRSWHELRMRVLAALFQWIMDTFHRLLVALERLLYSVDELVRFRGGDSRVSQMVKLGVGTAWFFVSYLIVFIFTLLVEPQINPIKHFPVVTVSHKLILPTWPILVKQLSPYLGPGLAQTVVTSTIWLIPGVFGFLVWELKENWRLYAANRPLRLIPVPIGHHGETMIRLLRPRFHSGTLPKLFASLRRATRKAERTGDWKTVNRRRAALMRVEEAIRQFAQRELCSMLNDAGVVPEGVVAPGALRVGTCRVDLSLVHARWPHEPLWLTWEEMDMVLTASITSPGWLEQLSNPRRHVLAGVLAGFFQRTGADRVRSDLPAVGSQPISWSRWVGFWSGTPRQTATSPKPVTVLE